MSNVRPRAFLVFTIVSVLLAAACTSSTSPSLPKLPDTSSTPPADGASLKATAPQPTSPPEGQEIIGPVTFRVNASQGLVSGQTFSYQFEIASASGAIVDTPTVEATTLVYSGVLPASSTFVWRARAARDGQFFGPWSDRRAFKTGALPGCNNGLLTDAPGFFYWKNNRTPGTPANDWISVMLSVGWPAGYGPGIRPPVGPPWYGFSQQIGAAGPRGRVFLPTSTPDALGYFSRETDFLTNCPGGLCWAWHEKTDAPQYAPQACP
jgi:hypothetical protein